MDIVVGVGYGEDHDRVRQVLEGILAQDERIIQDPAPMIGVLELGQRCVNLAVRPWVKTADYGEVLFAAQERIKTELEAEGIGIPIPQQEGQVR